MSLFTHAAAGAVIARSGGPSVSPGEFSSGLGSYFPLLTTLASVGLNIYGAVSEKNRRERLIQLGDERLRLEMEFAAQEEVLQVEQLSWDSQVAWGLAFNTDQIDSQSYREAVLSKFNGPLANREALARRREEFNMAKHFEALDMREGADIPREQLFASALNDGFQGFIGGTALLDKMRAFTAAGDIAGLQQTLMQSELDQIGRDRKLRGLDAQRITMQIDEMRRRMGGTIAGAASAFHTSINAPPTGQPARVHPGINTSGLAGQL